MAISEDIEIVGGSLPDEPGVYLYYDDSGRLLYVGKATSLKKRVGSYFSKKYSGDDVYGVRIAKMVGEISRIEFVETGTVIEALVLEANLVRVRKPFYNVKLQDDKSFLYLVFTREDFPKVLLRRGLELAREGIDPFLDELEGEVARRYLRVFGPFTSPKALRGALDLLRKIFPWSDCDPPEVSGRHRACFYSHIRLCPGVCSGAISKVEYRKNIRGLIQFFDGKRSSIVNRLRREMIAAGDKLDFERAIVLRRQVRSLEHIRDVSVITRDFAPLPFENPDKEYVDALGKVEAYDISHISGTNMVGAMTVFVDGRARKDLYRRFKIKTVDGVNDVGAMREMIVRRLARAERFPKAWALPDVMVIDGGEAQVGVVEAELLARGMRVAVVGLAKGPDRKQDVLVFDRGDVELARIAYGQKVLFQRVRDEAHRFAVAYHRKVRGKGFLNS